MALTFRYSAIFVAGIPKAVISDQKVFGFMRRGGGGGRRAPNPSNGYLPKLTSAHAAHVAISKQRNISLD